MNERTERERMAAAMSNAIEAAAAVVVPYEKRAAAVMKAKRDAAAVASRMTDAEVTTTVGGNSDEDMRRFFLDAFLLGAERIFGDVARKGIG